VIQLVVVVVLLLLLLPPRAMIPLRSL